MFALAEGRRGQTIAQVVGRCETLEVACGGCKLVRAWPPDQLYAGFAAGATLGAVAQRLVCGCGSRDGAITLRVDPREAAAISGERLEVEAAAQGRSRRPSAGVRRPRKSDAADLRAFRRIPHGPDTKLGDYQLYPGCRLLLFCGACTVAKGYNPAGIIERLRSLRTGGHDTRVSAVAKAVGWPCPSCGRMRWASQFAYPSDLDPREARHLAHRYRN